MDRRLHPRLGVENEPPAGLTLGDQDAVETDVEYANAMRQTANLDRDPALEAVPSFDRNVEISLAAGRDRYLGLAGPGHHVRRFDDRRPPAGRFVLDGLPVDRRPADEPQFRLGRWVLRVGIGPDRERRRVLVGVDARRRGMKAWRERVERHFNRSLIAVKPRQG